MKKKLPPLKKLKAKADALFSKYIRLKYANDLGYVKCYTCNTVAYYKTMQCGHYIKRNHLSTRWETRNARVQCVGCNMFRDGNYTEFSLGLNREDPNLLEELNQLKNQTKQMKRTDYNDLISDLNEKVKAQSYKTGET